MIIAGIFFASSQFTICRGFQSIHPNHDRSFARQQQYDDGKPSFYFSQTIISRFSGRIMCMSRNGRGDDEESEFEPLDVMLARARKRKVIPLLRVQAFFGAPVVESLTWLTRGDAVFAVIAISIGAKGFVLGLLLGKWSVSAGLFPQGMNLPPQLLQLYPLLLAIALDQFI